MEKITEKKKEKYQVRLLSEMTQHIGKGRTISMHALTNAVFESVNTYSMRRLRQLIEDLRKEKGMPICSSRAANGGGYYLASAGSEVEEFCMKVRLHALKGLVMEAKIRHLTLPEMLGQIKLEMS